MFSVITVYSILIIFLMYNSALSLSSTLYVLPSTFYSPHSTSYSLQSTIYHLPSKPTYTLHSTSYSLWSTLCALRLPSTLYPLSPSTLYSLRSTSFSLRSMLYALRSVIYPLGPSAWKVVEIFKFFLNFLMKTSEQDKGRLLVVVCFFVYFRHVSSFLRLLQGMITTNIEQHI